MYINFNIPTMEYYAAMKISGDSLLAQWKDIHDTLLIEKKIKVKKSTQSTPHFCVKSKVFKKSL